MDEAASRLGGEGGPDLLLRVQRKRSPGSGKEHIVAVNRVREVERRKAEAGEKIAGATPAVEVKVLVVVTVHVALKNVVVGHKSRVREVLLILGGLDDKEAVR